MWLVNPLENAKNERVQLLKQRAEIDRKLQAVESSIKLLEPVYGGMPSMPDVPISTGMTETIRELMIRTPGKLWSPTEMRDYLFKLGFDLASQANPLASIHTVLKRIAAGDRGFGSVDTEKGTVYKFDGIVSESKSNTKPVTAVTARKRTGKDFLL